LPRIRDILGLPAEADPMQSAASLPFGPGDVTAGAENEFQAVVMGSRDDIDLVRTIESANYYQNLQKRAETGESSRRTIANIEAFLSDNPDNVWENSWVRFHQAALSTTARLVFERDLLADKRNPGGPFRSDTDRFRIRQGGEPHIRIPVSYLLKLSLADAIHVSELTHPTVRHVGESLTSHFLNDNTSPEIFSFYPASLKRSNGMGRSLARETLKRFFLCQLLIQYANQKFGLLASGQRARIYFAPHTHIRQKILNDMISDAFYRELFMSPCLCGWDVGEDKHRYMGLCHQVLSRSQLNCISKLREAGIITRNLVVLPSLSNISLANNGTHVSLGSRKLTRLMHATDSGFGAFEEKVVGDLVIKITEHFLPLFVGTYSAAPYRLDFQDFHPEKVLGFLPHEIDFTHLRMIWRRWKKKAKLKIFGHPVTPFGPEWIDRLAARIFGLRGDVVADFRLLDYFVALMSTEQSPALDGRIGNDRRLKSDLADFGIFDTAMPAYLLYRLRNHAKYGFSGFEGRHYSLFMDIQSDMGHAVSLQNLVTALACKYILSGQVTHAHIPDTPFVESERRQVFFGTAIGIPTFFVHQETQNRFMTRILEKVRRKRPSHRYKNYIRIYNIEYRRALLDILRTDGADLVEMLDMGDTLRDLEARLNEPQTAATSGRLISAIMGEAGVSNPLKLPAHEFSQISERYYRETLRRRQMAEATAIMAEDFKRMDALAILRRDMYDDALRHVIGDRGAVEFFDAVQKDLDREEVPDDLLVQLIHLTLLSIHRDIQDHHPEVYPA